MVLKDERTGRLRDPRELEELRQTHDLEPILTLRFATIDVVVSRPDDDGRFTLAALDENGVGAAAEPEDVARAAAWLAEQGFVNAMSTVYGGRYGSRLFERADGWAVRYQCVLGAWTLELQPPGQSFVSFMRVRTSVGQPSWADELPDLIAALTGRSTQRSGPP